MIAQQQENKDISNQDKSALLQIEDLSKYFGAMAAVKNLDLRVFNGEIYGIAGPNGAGKTTLYNVITKFLPPSGGKVIFNGQHIHKYSPNKICELGIARTFQIPTLFESLTVYKNALIGAIYGKGNKKRDKESLVKKNLEFFDLWEKKDVIADELSLYERKVLMVATALTTEPRLLMLDEPTAGLSKKESEYIMSLFKKINTGGITIMIIEHNMDVLMNISERVMILDHGVKICEGTPSKVCDDERVIKAYLGERYEVKK